MKKHRLNMVWLALIVLGLATLACNALFPGSEDDTPWLPENPTQYTAEVQNIWDVFVVIDQQGNVVDFESDAPYGASAKMRYVLRFWDVSKLGGKSEAAIYRIYTPTEISSIANPENYSDEEEAAIYVRSDFPSTEVKLHDLTFTGGPEGRFIGTNSETGKDLFGHLEWNENTREMYAIFTEDIQQTYLVLGDEVFYNWP
jgi:hypothetical protein